jgi:hypothetical protein
MLDIERPLHLQRLEHNSFSPMEWKRHGVEWSMACWTPLRCRTLVGDAGDDSRGWTKKAAAEIAHNRRRESLHLCRTQFSAMFGAS